MTRWIPMIALLALSIPMIAAEPAVETGKLEQMAKAAKSASDHAAVAKQYRLRAEAFEAKAEKHESEAHSMRNSASIGIAAKWPAMAQKSVQKERQKAMQARRAASEAYELADRHSRLAVEAGFISGE